MKSSIVTVSALTLFTALAGLPGCHWLSGSARTEKPPTPPANSAQAAAAAAATPPDLLWERGAERLKPVPNERGELVFKDDLVVAENAFLTLGTWNGSSVQSLTVTHEAEDAQGQVAVASADVPVTHDSIGDRWRLRLEAFLNEGLQSQVGELTHRLTIAIQDGSGNRGQFVARFRVRGSEAVATLAAPIETPEVSAITRPTVEAGTAFVKRVTLRNPYPTSLTIWAPGASSATLVQKLNHHHLRQSNGGPASLVDDSYLSRTTVQVVPRMLSADGRPLEERVVSGQPPAWVLPPGETATLTWHVATPSAVCSLPAPEPQRVEWTVLENQCTQVLSVKVCSDKPVVKSASTTIEWTRVEAKLEGEAALNWDSSWNEEYSPKHLKRLAPQKWGGAELTATYSTPCQGLY